MDTKPISSKREFVGIGIPESVRNYLAGLCDRSLASIDWIPKENFHLTMRFLGDISEEPEEKLCRLLRAVTVSPFTLEIGSFGTFPSKGQPKVIWVGLGTGHPLLFQLRQKIDDTILRAGIDCEMRDFVPHITLGRCPSGNASEVKTLVTRTNLEHGPIFSVQHFSLFESRRHLRGSRYLELESFPLKRG